MLLLFLLLGVFGLVRLFVGFERLLYQSERLGRVSWMMKLGWRLVRHYEHVEIRSLRSWLFVQLEQ